MSRVSFEPIVTSDQPTSHVTVATSRLPPGVDTDMAHVEHKGFTVTFAVDAENDLFSGSDSSDIWINERAAALFPEIDRDDPFYVEADASPLEVPTADTVTINPMGVDPEQLAAILRQRGALLHPITETYDYGKGTVEFVVADVEPDRVTVRVDDDTTFEFDTDATEPAAPDATSADTAPGPGGSGPGGGAGGGGGGGRGGADEEEDASINVQPTEPQKTFEEDVAGLEEVKRTAQMMLSLFDRSVSETVVDEYGESFADRSGGMMLYGPPGCGKTLISEAIAYEAKHNTDIEAEYGDVVFLEVRGSDVVSKYAGESEKNVEAAFDQAHELASGGFAVLFFDEVETLIPDRSDDNLQRHERALTNAFLQQMNDVEDNLLVIGATNMPFSIDPAATRRFPIQQFIPQPGPDVMAEVWETSLGKIAERDDVDCTRLGEESVGYTPAEIADRVLGSDLQRELVESVALDDREPIQPDTEYLLEKLSETEPKTVRQYVSSVTKQAQELEGFPQMKTYVEDQARKFGMLPGAPGGAGEGADGGG